MRWRFEKVRPELNYFVQKTGTVCPNFAAVLGVGVKRQSKERRFFTHFRPLFLSWLMLACFSVKGADDTTNDLTALSLEELGQIRVTTVYGVSGYIQKTKDAPSSVTIIDSDEIKKYGWRTMADILQSASGFYVSYDRDYNYLGVRGFDRVGDYNSRVLMLVDGHRINDDVYGSASIGTEFPLDVDVIDHIEIARGPCFSTFGNNADFAVINVITKRGRDFDGGEASVEGGSYDTYKGRFSFGKRFQNEMELMFSGTFYNSEGHDQLYYPEFNTPTNNVNNGITKGTDSSQYYNFISTFSYRDLTIQGVYGSREKQVPTASYGTTFNSTQEKTVDEQAYVDALYSHEFENDWVCSARLYFDQYHYDGHYPYEPVMNYDYGDGKKWGAKLQATKKFFDRHTFLVGAEIQDNFQQDQGNYDITPRTVYLDDHHSSWNWALHGQADIAILTNVILSTGVRYDHYDTFGDTVNPRVGLIVRPFPTTTLKLLYGTAFRAPNAYELYYAEVDAKVNPSLQPEKTTTYQGVWEQDLPQNLHFNATAYYYVIDDLISLTTDPNDGKFVFENIDKVNAKGLEFGLEGTRPSGLRGRLSYSLQKAEDGKTGEELGNSPHHLAKLNLIVPLYRDRLFSGLELQYVSDVKTLQRNTVSDYFLVNLTLFSQKLVKGLDISASIYNLFDERYSNPGSIENLQDRIQQDGRTFRVKLTYRF